MLTKAIVQKVDYTKNICRVRIPLFENASRNVNMIEADAQFSVTPGIYNSYKTGDVVFIGFEENKMEAPIILGKLFVSPVAEANSQRGTLSGNALLITDTAQLPYSTIFNYGSIAQNSNIYFDLNTPKKLADSIIDLQRAQTQRYQTIIKIAINGVTYNLYIKTSYDFTYSPNSSDEPIDRLCAALFKSHAENTIIPLDMAVAESDNKIYQAAIQIQDASPLGLTVIIGNNSYQVLKEAIQSIQSFVVYY